GDDAGQGDHRRGSHLARDLLDGKTSAQPDGALEAELGNQLPKDRLLDAGADDLAAEANAPPPEDAAGLDQDGEPLLLDQPPDPEDAIRRALGGRRGGEEREVDAVVEAHDLLLEARRARSHLEEGPAVVVADRH